MKAIVVGAILVLIIAGFAYQLFGFNASPVSTEESSPTDLILSQHSELDEKDISPLAVSNPLDSDLPPLPVSEDQAPSLSAQTVPPQQGSAPIPSWDALLSESELATLVNRLRSDPGLLQQLIDEFRQETDLSRKAVLAGVLGEVGGDDVILLASELIFSGNESERTVGLNLLQDIQPGNVQARDIVSSMLATEVEPSVLIETMTVLSQPGNVDEVSRAYLSDQLAWLSTHEDVSVRGISLDILSRWSNDGRYTDVYLNALDDESANVRSSAAYALVGHEFGSATLNARLFRTLEDTAEFKGVRRAAALALNSMPLAPAQQARLQSLERALDTEVR